MLLPFVLDVQGQRPAAEWARIVASRILAVKMVKLHDMSNRWVAILLFGGVIFFVANHTHAQRDRFEDEDRKRGWIFNYEQAKAQARKSNRPMMVVFRCVP